MANTATYGVPDPARVASGQILQTSPDELAAAAAMHNWFLAEHGCSAISAGWPDGAFAHSGAKALGPTIQVPVLSDRHSLVRVIVTYTAVGAAPAAIFTVGSVSGGDTQATAALGAGGPLDVTLPDLTISTAAAFDDVTIEVESTAGQTVTVHDVRIQIVPLSSPLAAEAVSGAAPLGVAAAGADMPHTARLNADMLEALPILRVRPRILWQWSGLGAIGTDAMQEKILHRAMIQTWPGVERAGVEYDLRIKVRNDEADTRYVYLQVGDPRGFLNQQIAIEVASGFTGYKTESFTIAEGVYVDGYPYAAAILGIAINVGDEGYGRTGVDVLQLAIMGE